MDRANVLAVVERHIQAELNADFDAIIATFSPDPYWKLLPQGRVFEGRGAIRYWYETVIGGLARLNGRSELLGMWSDGHAVVRRDYIEHDVPKGRFRFEVMSLIMVEADAVSAEMAYGWPDASLIALGVSA